jgi:hypothetical protein
MHNHDNFHLQKKVYKLRTTAEQMPALLHSLSVTKLAKLAKLSKLANLQTCKLAKLAKLA